MEIPEEMIETLVPAVRGAAGVAGHRLCQKLSGTPDGAGKTGEQEALELMAQALAITINAMVVGGRSFDSGKYKALLKDLPALPDEAP